MLACLAAPIQALWWRQSGCDALHARNTLNQWLWETQQGSDAWMPLLQAFPLPHLPVTFGRYWNHHLLSGHVVPLNKTFPPQGFSAEWHWLQARAAEDSMPVLVAESLPRGAIPAATPPRCWLVFGRGFPSPPWAPGGMVSRTGGTAIGLRSAP